jgi:hypothetical protein
VGRDPTSFLYGHASLLSQDCFANPVSGSLGPANVCGDGWLMPLHSQCLQPPTSEIDILAECGLSMVILACVNQKPENSLEALNFGPNSARDSGTGRHPSESSSFPFDLPELPPFDGPLSDLVQIAI